MIYYGVGHVWLGYLSAFFFCFEVVSGTKVNLEVLKLISIGGVPCVRAFGALFWALIYDENLASMACGAKFGASERHIASLLPK